MLLRADGILFLGEPSKYCGSGAAIGSLQSGDLLFLEEKVYNIPIRTQISARKNSRVSNRSATLIR